MSQTTDSTTGHAGDTAHQVDRSADARTSPEPVWLLTRFSAIDDAAARTLADELRTTAASVVARPGELTYGVSGEGRRVLPTPGADSTAQRVRSSYADRLR
jgi:hypothetical protein